MNLNVGINAGMTINVVGLLLMKKIIFASCIQHAMIWIKHLASHAQVERKHVDLGKVAVYFNMIS